ncbi:hypothetical protein [Hymenobacter rubidus]|uniref:hypothetical protein n=1 Tax=Hymenobacter rubidus TaxID=1441626 RepID=UPI00191F78CE|nr:hypothetical protein [Hymenobacter rubidus]
MQTATFAAAATKDFRPAPLTYSEDEACYTGYIPALHESVKHALTIEADCRSHNVFALHSEYRAETDSDYETNSNGRFAIARPVAREDWHTIKPGTIILYVAKWVPSEEEAAEGLRPCFGTQVGPLALFDEKRGILYAASWETTCGSNTPHDYEANNIYEMHVIERFIEVE